MRRRDGSEIPYSRQRPSACCDCLRFRRRLYRWPGDVVIMDNLGSHKRHTIRRAIRAVRAKLLFLPAYSPDLNPIEQVFAKLKTLLRKLDARTVETTWRGIGQLLDAFTPLECANYLRNSGYASA